MKLLECTRCPLCKVRKNVVPGVGNFDARLMFVGQNPGSEEDQAGKPFVGKSGMAKVDVMLDDLKLTRSNVFITNAVKCHTEGNREPVGHERDMCLPWLSMEIERVRPDVIVTFGNTPIKSLLGRSGITKLRGKWHYNKQHNIYLFPMLHPACTFGYRNSRDRGGVMYAERWDEDIRTLAEALETDVLPFPRKCIQIDRQWYA